MDKRRSDTFLQFFKKEFEYGLRTNKHWSTVRPSEKRVNVGGRSKGEGFSLKTEGLSADD